MIGGIRVCVERHTTNSPNIRSNGIRIRIPIRIRIRIHTTTTGRGVVIVITQPTTLAIRVGAVLVG